MFVRKWRDWPHRGKLLSGSVCFPRALSEVKNEGPFKGTQRDYSNCLLCPVLYHLFFFFSFLFCPEDVSCCCPEGEEKVFPRDVNFKAEQFPVTRLCWKYPSRFAWRQQGPICLTCKKHGFRKMARSFGRFFN